MSDMYLTKVERKTIFTRALVYVLFMFVISDLTITGPFYFNFIPWIFILGLIASKKYITPVMNIFITSFTVFLSSLIVEGKINLNVILFTVSTIVLVVLGTIVGRGIDYLKQENKLQIFLAKDKKIFMILIITIFTIIAFYVSDYIYSGTYKYIESYINFKNQLEAKYNIKSY